jgi:hypothetical protein
MTCLMSCAPLKQDGIKFVSCYTVHVEDILHCSYFIITQKGLIQSMGRFGWSNWGCCSP